MELTGWKMARLGDVVRLQRGYDLPASERQPGSVPVMGSAGLTGFHSVSKSKGPGVTIGRSGESMGVVSYCPLDYWPHNTTLFVTDFLNNYPRFVFYLLQQCNLRQFDSGSVQASLNRNYIYPLPVILPPLNEQKLIAGLFGSLDDKIALNRRMNETLEALARTLFKAWFVYFEEFGGTMPEDWRIGTVKEVTGFLNGYAFKSSDWQQEGVPVVKIGSIKPGIVDLSQVSFVSASVAQQAKKYELVAGDLLIGMTGYVGEVGLVPISEIAPLLNQRVGRFLLSERGTRQLGFIYCLTRDENFKKAVEQTSHGTAQANVSAEGILSVKTIVPPDKIIDQFNAFARPLLDRILANEKENQTLKNLRDTLLPRLLSGELRVRDAERTVEDTVTL